MPRRKRKQVAAKANPPPDPAPQPAEARAHSPAGSELNPAKMTVAQLREELETRGEETRGRKAELVARLQAAVEAGDASEPPAKKTKTVRHDIYSPAGQLHFSSFLRAREIYGWLVRLDTTMTPLPLRMSFSLPPFLR